MSSKKYYRMASQIIFLALFTFLFYLNQLQLWIVVFIIGAVASIGLGRFYCGWVCPMDSLSRTIIWLKGKLSLNALDVPDVLRSKKLRYTIVLVFLGTMVGLRVLGKELPVLLVITAIGVAFMTIFDEELFHKYLCPYGTILRFSSKPSKYVMNVDTEECIECGRCQSVCPSETIETLDFGKRQVIDEECLKCFKCQDVCPADCIEYKKKD